MASGVQAWLCVGCIIYEMLIANRSALCGGFSCPVMCACLLSLARIGFCTLCFSSGIALFLLGCYGCSSWHPGPFLLDGSAGLKCAFSLLRALSLHVKVLIARALNKSLALWAQPSSFVFVGLGALDCLPRHPSPLRSPLRSPFCSGCFLLLDLT